MTRALAAARSARSAAFSARAASSRSFRAAKTGDTAGRSGFLETGCCLGAGFSASPLRGWAGMAITAAAGGRAAGLAAGCSPGRRMIRALGASTFRERADCRTGASTVFSVTAGASFFPLSTAAASWATGVSTAFSGATDASWTAALGASSPLTWRRRTLTPPPCGRASSCGAANCSRRRRASSSETEPCTDLMEEPSFCAAGRSSLASLPIWLASSFSLILLSGITFPLAPRTRPVFRELPHASRIGTQVPASTRVCLGLVYL